MGALDLVPVGTSLMKRTTPPPKTKVLDME